MQPITVRAALDMTLLDDAEKPEMRASFEQELTRLAKELDTKA